MRLSTGLFFIALLCGASAATAADPYPVKPVRIVVAGAAGGGDDFAGRQVAAALSELLGQQFIVENRAGAGGMIGQTYVAKSAPDGYTLLLAGGSMAGARYVNANVTYDLMKDFTPISLIETSPFALVTRPTLPAANVGEVIALARSQPGKMTFATLGPGQIPYWSAALFHGMARIDAVEVQYKSLGDAIADVMAGRVDYYFAPVFSALGAKEKVKVLAVTSRERSDLLPAVPTMAEAALPGYEMPSWRSIMGPGGMRPEVVETLSKAMARALANPDVRSRFLKGGSVATASTPEELRKRYEDWAVIFGRIARETGLKPQ
jgi:tripartite-type tricarboxylate transporter receptor subunit TctC